MFGDYIVYVDESGDHGLDSIQEPYPIFVLSCCIFQKEEYRRSVVPAFMDLKFRFFGHDQVVLHSHEIRKQHGPFRTLVNANLRIQFLEALQNALASAQMTIVATIIDKKELRKQYPPPSSPYEIAMRFCLEKTYEFLRSLGQGERQTEVVVERRGAVEDRDLELAFRRIVQGDNCWGPIPLDIVFADKRSNSTGLQIADLVSHPIGRHYLSPVQANRAYDVIATKFCAIPDGDTTVRGPKVFP